MTKLTREQLNALPAHPHNLTKEQYVDLWNQARRALELEEFVQVARDAMAIGSEPAQFERLYRKLQEVTR